MQSAQKGIITPQMTKAAYEEALSPQIILNLIAEGKAVIPHNINRNARPIAIGKNLLTKINANLGTSEMRICLEEEIEKLRLAEKYGAHSVMDLSTGGDLDWIRRELLSATDLIFGTVPVYAVFTELLKENMETEDMEPEKLWEEIEKEAEQGVDFMTIHAGITRNSIFFQERQQRVLGTVSRGGSLLKKWMIKNNRENPLYEDFDRLLHICAKHDVTISLGDGFRPGALADATDRAQVAEMLVLGELVDACRRSGVQVMVEGPGHVPLNDITANVLLQKRICKEAPFYVLGPLPTDVAVGYDHIAGAIGSAVAGAAGADFLCYLTPAEHLCLPTADDVKQGVIASRIAAHIADIAKEKQQILEIDNRISKARREMDWKEVFALCLDPELAFKRKQETSPDITDYCSMCGKLCAIKSDKSIKE